MKTQNVTSLEPVESPEWMGIHKPQFKKQNLWSPYTMGKDGEGVQRWGQGNACPQKPYSLRRVRLTYELDSTTRKKERMPLEPQTQIATGLGQRPGGKWHVLWPWQREGDEDSGTGEGERCKPELQRGTWAEKCRWTWRESDFVQTQGRLKYNSIKLNWILQVTRVHVRRGWCDQSWSSGRWYWEWKDPGAWQAKLSRRLGICGGIT